MIRWYNFISENICYIILVSNEGVCLILLIYFILIEKVCITIFILTCKLWVWSTILMYLLLNICKEKNW